MINFKSVLNSRKKENTGKFAFTLHNKIQQEDNKIPIAFTNKKNNYLTDGNNSDQPIIGKNKGKGKFFPNLDNDVLIEKAKIVD